MATKYRIEYRERPDTELCRLEIWNLEQARYLTNALLFVGASNVVLMEEQPMKVLSETKVIDDGPAYQEQNH